jgi:hypothetical protein
MHLLPTRRTTERDNESMDSVWQSALVLLQAFQLAFLLAHDWIPQLAPKRRFAARWRKAGIAALTSPPGTEFHPQVDERSETVR